MARPPRDQLPPLKEPQWQDTVMRTARLQRWFAYHVYDSRRSTPGFPDCIFLRDGRLVVAELKTENGRLTEDQKKWLAQFQQCPGVEVHVWRPSDWKKVEEVLR